MKQKLFTIVLALIVFFTVEGLSAFGLKLLEDKKNVYYQPASANKLTKVQRANIHKLLNHKERYITHSPELGWTIMAKGSVDDYHANAQGIRANQEYELTPSKDKIRIATFGDSFVHCDEVKNNETWQEHLNNLNKKLETINLGVGGYGLDQSYLRYLHDGRKLNPDIVIIALMTENVIRNLNVFRPFYYPETGLPLAKPRFRLLNEKLVLIKNPLSQLADYQNLLDDEENVMFQLAKKDYSIRHRYKKPPLDFLMTVRLLTVLRSSYLEPKEYLFKGKEFNTDSEYFKVTAAILDKFYNTVLTDGAIPIVAIIPNGGDLWRLYESNSKQHAPFLRMMAAKGYRHIDLTDNFFNDKYSDDLRDLQAPKLHYSSLGNQRLAEYFNNYLIDNNILELIKR